MMLYLSGSARQKRDPMKQAAAKAYTKLLTEDFYMDMIERFIRYASIRTGSDASSNTIPSTMRQFDLAHLLVYELKQIGLQDAQVNYHGIVYTKLPPSSACTHCTAIGFLGHLDTHPGVPGKNVRPQIIPHYDGKDIRLGQSDVFLRTAVYPHLLQLLCLSFSASGFLPL